MRIVDKGVLSPSFMDFSIPSEFAQKALYYSPQFGRFLCDGMYRIDRESLDQYLLVYVNSGTLHMMADGESAVLTVNQIALIDCRKPHRYWCEDKVDFYWFHFNGNSSQQYFAYLHDRFGIQHAGQHILPLKDYFFTLTQSAQTMLTNEHEVSSCIHSILSGLALPDVHTAVVDGLLMPAITYIHSHFADDVSLGTLAEISGMSKSHFIRSFHRYINCTPHEYLLRYRLRQAKRLLLTTSSSMEQIAEQCGFNSASHFSRAFRQGEGLSPSTFRTVSAITS